MAKSRRRLRNENARLKAEVARLQAELKRLREVGPWYELLSHSLPRIAPRVGEDARVHSHSTKVNLVWDRERTLIMDQAPPPKQKAFMPSRTRRLVRLPQPRKVKAVGDVICVGTYDLEEQYIGWKCTRCGHSQIFAPWEGLDDDEYSDEWEEYE